ncbi:hypothetical protein [Microcoleus sp. herbarium14]|uniref:hypothetical protein n=1 Tax=Microcoleus sp. herbarium14 TaxID=3055439 RepID=UPI002FD562E6
MVRIKGANSDYVYTGNPEQPIEEKKDADPLYLKIFICPNDMPSRIEKPHANGWCEGTDGTCPDDKPSKKSGHAMICLDEKDGISLVTQNQIIAKGNFIVECDGKKIIEVTDKAIAVSFGGTIIRIADGEIQLSSQNNKPIQISGNLAISGDVKITGKVDLSQADVTFSKATIEQIKKS